MNVKRVPGHTQVHLSRCRNSERRRACKSLDDIVEDETPLFVVYDDTDAFDDSLEKEGAKNVDGWPQTNSAMLNPSNSIKKTNLNRHWKSTADIEDTYVDIKSPSLALGNTEASHTRRNHSIDSTQSDVVVKRDSGFFSDTSSYDRGSASIYTPMGGMDYGSQRLTQSRSSTRSRDFGSNNTDSKSIPALVIDVAKDDSALPQRKTRPPSSIFCSLDRRRFKQRSLPKVPSKSHSDDNILQSTAEEENIYAELPAFTANNEENKIVKHNSLNDLSRSERISPSITFCSEKKVLINPLNDAKPPKSNKHTGSLKRKVGLLKGKLSHANLQNNPQIEQVFMQTSPLPPFPIQKASSGVVEDPYSYISDLNDQASSKNLNPPFTVPLAPKLGSVPSSPTFQRSPTVLKAGTDFGFAAKNDSHLTASVNAVACDTSAACSPVVAPSPFIHQSSKHESAPGRRIGTIGRPTVAIKVGPHHGPQEEYHASTLSRYRPKTEEDTRTEEERILELDLMLHNFDTSLDIQKLEATSETARSRSSSCESPACVLVDKQTTIIDRSSNQFVDPVQFYKSQSIPVTASNLTPCESEMPQYSVVRKNRTPKQTDSQMTTNDKKPFTETDDYAEITEEDLYNMPKRKYCHSCATPKRFVKITLFKQVLITRYHVSALLWLQR